MITSTQGLRNNADESQKKWGKNAGHRT